MCYDNIFWAFYDYAPVGWGGQGTRTALTGIRGTHPGISVKSNSTTLTLATLCVVITELKQNVTFNLTLFL